MFGVYEKASCYFLCCLCQVNISLQCTYCVIFQCYKFLPLTCEKQELLIVSYHVRMKKFCTYRPEVNCLTMFPCKNGCSGKVLYFQLRSHCSVSQKVVGEKKLLSVRIGTLGCLSTYSWRHISKVPKCQQKELHS